MTPFPPEEDPSTQLWLIEPSRFAAVLGDGTSRAPASGDESLRLPPGGDLLLPRQAAAAQPALATDSDLADAEIAHSCRWLGGEVLATFDRKAAALPPHYSLQLGVPWHFYLAIVRKLARAFSRLQWRLWQPNPGTVAKDHR